MISYGCQITSLRGENHATLHYGAAHLAQPGGLRGCGRVCECNELSGPLGGAVYLRSS